MGLKHLAKKWMRTLFGRDLLPAYTLPISVRQLRLFDYFSRTYARIKNVEGAIVECGVGKGRTILYLTHLAALERKERSVWGFDSFAGFPEPSIHDKSDRNPKAGEWSDTSPELVLGQMRTAGIPASYVANHVRLVPGFFPESFDRYTGGPIALLHVDVDLYDSYRSALEYFEPKVVSGGVILFDEYGEERWPGAKRAIDEYFGEQAPIIFDPIVKKHYLIKA